MPDHRNRLQGLFSVENRYANFGNLLMRIKIQGFRCHDLTIIDIENPITAFCGLNGTGKSTLLQLAAAAYSKIDSETRRYYIKDFIVSGILDPAPFKTDAVVEYGYWQEERTIKTVYIKRSESEKRWAGYRSQPKRTVYFAGMGLYLPKIEIRDFVLRNASNISVLRTEPLAESSKNWACKILGCSYDAMENNEVKHNDRKGEVVTVMRAGNKYSEANMGCGEGRTQHIIRRLQTLPDKSLVLLEEPETSLHPSAQHEFGKYLIDVCIEKKHQILISTHSEYLLSALPSASRIYLDRSIVGLRPIKGITTAQAISLMTEGHDKALHILVEDEVAGAVLTEILRKADYAFLKSVKIHSTGDTKTIHSVMKALKDTGLPVAAVRDGDKNDSPADNIFKLPGGLAPEKELLGSANVIDFFREKYEFDVPGFSATMRDIDHHEWFAHLAERISINKNALIQQSAECYVENLSANNRDTITSLLKESLRK